MGKPKCTDELIADAVRCKKNGMSNKDIASYVGVNEATLYRWLGEPKSDKQRELGKSLKEAESEFKAALRSRIVQASDHSWQAAAWMLERQYPEEYARPEVQFAKQAAAEAAAETAKAMTDVFVKIREAAGADRADS